MRKESLVFMWIMPLIDTFWHIIRKSNDRIYAKYLDRQVWANSVGHDQMQNVASG